VNGKVVLGVLAVIGMLALSASVAQAGGGGVPVALKSFFVCHAINGANLGTPVDVQSDEAGLGGGVRALVTVGQAIFACAQAALFQPGTPDEISPSVPGRPSPQELKCYTASTSKKSGQAGLFNIEDALSGTETVEVARDVKYICGPAFVSE
jgi:hypothetical protein